MASSQRFPQYLRWEKTLKNILKIFSLTLRFEPGSPNPKSAMLAPRPRIYEKCLKCVKILNRVFKIQILDVFCIKSWKNILFRSAEGSKLNCHQLSGEVAMFLSKWQWFAQNIGDENLWWHKIGLIKKRIEPVDKEILFIAIFSFHL